MTMLSDHPHKRQNLLTGEWILVSPHRAKRPWQGQVEDEVRTQGLAHDPECYLCAGNSRITGDVNPDYKDTFVFDNDFAALTTDAPQEEINNGLLRAHAETGICRVVCFSPRHNLTLARMETGDIARVVDTWVEQYCELGTRSDITYVQIFENRGAMMGCSNPHPHGQIWASSTLPNEIEKEQQNQLAYFTANKRPLLMDYLAQELEAQERIIYQNESFVVLVPFWAVWPFETMVLPKRAISSMEQMTDKERTAFADVLSNITIRYDNLFRTSFPYSMGFHQRPTDGEEHPEWVFHAHFYPPLLRSATVKKFMVGYELLGGPQRDITAEQAAQRLRDLSDKHYLED